MDLNTVLQGVSITLLGAAIIGLVKLYGTVLVLAQKIEDQETFYESKFVSLKEVVEQLRLDVGQKKKSRGG